MSDFSPVEDEARALIAKTAQRLDSLVRYFEQHPNDQVREQVMELLRLIDTIHRPGVQRMAEVMQGAGTHAVEDVLNEPAVQVLFELYRQDADELTPLEQVEIAIDTVRPYIESHGGAVEVLNVVEGVVHLRLSGACQGCAGSAVTLKHGIEAALAEGYRDYRSIVVHEPEQPPARNTGSFIPLEQIGIPVRALKKPVFTAVTPLAELKPGQLKAVEAEGISILLCNYNGEVYAYRNACTGSDLPLNNALLNGSVLLCPWHNCPYDVRTGKRLDGQSGRLQVIPVAIQNGTIQLALNVQPY